MNSERSRLLLQSVTVSLTKQDVYRCLFWFIWQAVIIYNFHRYILQYGHADFVQSNYQPTPLFWQVGKYILVSLLMSLIYSFSTFERSVQKDLIWLYGLLIAGFALNVMSTLKYRVSIFDEYEYQLFALVLLPLTLVKREQLLFLKDAIYKVWLNTTQYILLVANGYVILNYIISGRLPFHAYTGIIVRFGGLWDDPNALGIVSTLLFAYAFRQRQYIVAGLHVLSIILTFSLTSIILLLMTVIYLSYRRIAITTLIIGAAIGLCIACILAYIFQEPLLAFYEIKRQSVEMHSTFDNDFYLLPLMQPMFMHETWWFSMLYNYSPLSFIAPVLGSYFTIKAFFFDQESLQRLYFILFIVSSLFLPFLYIFPLNFILCFWAILYVKKIRF